MFQGFALETIKIRINGKEISERNRGVFKKTTTKYFSLISALESKKGDLFCQAVATAPMFQGFALQKKIKK